MKTLIACLCLAAVGVAVGVNINQRRYGHYQAALGPISYRGEISAENAMASLEKDWAKTFPKVELPDGNTHDFGVMAPEEEGEHIFRIKNVGEAPLTLVIGASTCKCTIGELGDESLQPGEETEVKMSWSVKTNESSFGQSAELRTNDPTNVAIRLEITGQVVRQVQLVPEEITFGEIAAGEDVEFEVKVFNYKDQLLKPGDVKFSDADVNDLASIEVTPFQPSAEDGVNEAAKQGFLVKATIKPGLKQGPVNQNLILNLQPADGHTANEDGPEEKPGEDKTAADSENAASADSDQSFVYIPVTGRIVGVLSLLPNTRMTGVSGGGYIYNFGILKDDDDLTAKIFVSLKGSEHATTKLSIGEIEPAENVEATLGDRIEKDKMTLYRLQLRLKPGAESVDRLGMNKGDYGFLMIESDNPKVPALKLILKFSLPAR
jgi:hypothetical protein